MSKIKHFGPLRMEFMRLDRNKGAFRVWIEANYTKEEQKRIGKAFLTIGTDHEVKAGEKLAK